MYFAVVGKKFDAETSSRVCSFTGNDKADVIQRALAQRRAWETGNGGGNGPYRILTGEITTEVIIPEAWTETAFPPVQGR